MQAQPSPYADRASLAIRALTPEQIAGYRAGDGMGQALVAELNGYPGPRHVLELADSLALPADRRAAVQAIFDRMHDEAVRLGEAVIAVEAGLDSAFVGRRITQATLEERVTRIATLLGRLRSVHLEAHLAVTALLTPDQIRTYQRLRGYGDRGPAGHQHDHEEPAVTVFAAGAVTPVSGQGTPGVDRLTWLQGCWEAASPQRTMEEQWMAPRGGSMLGMSRTIRGDRLTGHELVVLREREGRLVYQAHPSGQPSAEFPLLTLGDSMVVFEDPQHDFPQRVVYRRPVADSLLAWIEGTANGQERRIEFRYRRVPCPGT
jgi:hypothetical protein